uniref:Glycosyl hydrolase family 30 beta sandwich domain-containing protein n=1 Tax=Timema cristinae TaxID=61476 RepID=A0A7R9HE83_TIMCR|nr:unnamed protein product [Timema cristinae]
MFVPPDSQHVSLTSENDGGLLNVAFLTPENDVVVVLMNSTTPQFYSQPVQSDVLVSRNKQCLKQRLDYRAEPRAEPSRAELSFEPSLVNVG